MGTYWHLTSDGTTISLNASCGVGKDSQAARQYLLRDVAIPLLLSTLFNVQDKFGAPAMWQYNIGWYCS